MLTVTLEQFTGPLDVLLQLIEREKLDITSLSLSKVTDDYFALLAQLQENMHLDELAEFLVVASKLLLIKSYCLIPSVSHEEEEEIGEFEERLRLYREFVNAGKHIERLWNRHADMFSRPRSITPSEVRFSPPKRMSAAMLHDTIARCAERSARYAASAPAAIQFGSRISLEEKMGQIRELLSKRANAYFNHLLSSSADKAEIIVSFLAILELVKQRVIVARQESLFSEITFSPHCGEHNSEAVCA